MKNTFASRFSKLVESCKKPRTFVMVSALLASMVLLTGCLSRPALKTKTFSFDIPAVAATDRAATGPVLGIKTVTVAAPFADRPLIYRTGEFNYQRDPYAEFLDFPQRELMAVIRAGLGSEGDFSSVVMTGTALEPDVIVEVNISQLFGDFRVPTGPKAILRAQFIFCQTTNGTATRAILQKEYSRTIPIGKPTAAALMAGWNQALNEILREVLKDYRSARN